MDFAQFAQLGGTVMTVALFIWYLINRNSKQERAMKGVTDALDNLHTAQETHTKVLMKVAGTHGLEEQVDKLIDK